MRNQKIATESKPKPARFVSRPLHTLSISFNLELEPEDIEMFRGAFADLAGRDNDLFHNHNNSNNEAGGVLYRYPRIQYRVHNHRATIFAINEGVAALHSLIENKVLRNFVMNGRRLPLEVVELRETNCFKPEMLARGKYAKYRIYKWLALNSDNYQLYKACADMHQRLDLLERLLRSNLESFAENTGWKIPPKKLKVNILDFDRVSKINILDTDMMAFDLVFEANVKVPDRIGLGRKSAFGFGWIFGLKE